MTVTADRALDAAEAALTRATRHLLALQQPEGWWKGELETNVTIDAEDLFLRHFLGLLDGKTAAATAGWIRGRQRPDGSWATYHGGPGDLSTSLEAYVALRLAGDAPDAEHMRRAAAFVRDAGGAGQSRVFTRMWLSLLGLWSWSDSHIRVNTRLCAAPPASRTKAAARAMCPASGGSPARRRAT